MENLYLNIIIEYYACFLVFIIPKLFCILMYLYVLCSVQKYPEIYYY